MYLDAHSAVRALTGGLRPTPPRFELGLEAAVLVRLDAAYLGINLSFIITAKVPAMLAP